MLLSYNNCVYSYLEQKSATLLDISSCCIFDTAWAMTYSIHTTKVSQILPQQQQPFQIHLLYIKYNSFPDQYMLFLDRAELWE